MEYREQTNSTEEEAELILKAGRILTYGLGQIRLVEVDYPDEIDLTAPIASANLADEDFKHLAPKEDSG